MSDHLVVFEYGTGAVWGFVRADSPSAITEAVPELDVLDGAPPWLTSEDLEAMRETSVDLGDGNVIERLMHG